MDHFNLTFFFFSKEGRKGGKDFFFIFQRNKWRRKKENKNKCLHIEMSESEHCQSYARDTKYHDGTLVAGALQSQVYFYTRRKMGWVGAE